MLKHVYPDADVPVVQLSINETRPAAFHFEIGQRLAPLRQEGVLIVGSGNLVHNLHTYAWGRHMPDPYDWATRFEATAREMMVAGDYRPLIDYETLGRDAMLSIPTPTTICRCSTCWRPGSRAKRSAFRSRASMAARSRC